jgi:hypothetical protein
MADSYHISRRITGEPTDRNRVHRAHRSSWDHMQRPGWSDVKVTLATGEVIEGVPASVFSRRKLRTMRALATADALDRQNKLDAHRIRTSADLEALQNYETDA